MANGNGGKWSLWMAGIIATLLIGAVSTLAASVVTNDKGSRDRDTDQIEQISTNKADMREVRTKLTYIEKAQGTMRKEQKEGFNDIKDMIKQMHSS